MGSNKSGNLNGLKPAAAADRMILGDGPDCVFSTDSDVTGINNNVLVVGGSGSGKTVSIAEAFLLESKKRSIITTVTKRRIVSKYTPMLQDRRYEVWDLDFVHPERGNIGFDPMDTVHTPADISFLARSIVLSNPQRERSGEDSYWTDAAMSLMKALISYTVQEKERPSFADVLEMLDNLIFEEGCGQIRTNYDRKFDYLAQRDPSNFAVTNWKSFCKLPVRTAGCVFGTLNSCVDMIFTPELRSMFRMRRKVNIRQMARKRTALFITTSPVNPSINCFINMFYAQVFKELFELGEEQPDGRLPVPVHLLADDFCTGCPVPLFDQYISILREKGISVTLLMQSESQLTALYGPDAATTIINNCDSYVFMGSNDLYTARSISQRANRPLEDILHMPIGRQILFRRGVKPKMGKRYNILENETYQKITAASNQRIAMQKQWEKGPWTQKPGR